MAREHYLGDGLYASIEGGLLKLFTQRENGEHFVYLEQSTWLELQRFVAEQQKPKLP